MVILTIRHVDVLSGESSTKRLSLADQDAGGNTKEYILSSLHRIKKSGLRISQAALRPKISLNYCADINSISNRRGA